MGDTNCQSAIPTLAEKPICYPQEGKVTGIRGLRRLWIEGEPNQFADRRA